MWNARHQTSRNASAISPKASACCARCLSLSRGSNRSQPLGVELGQVEHVVLEIVRHLALEPPVDAQRRLVDFFVVSRVANCALGFARSFQIVGHLLPPAMVLEPRVFP